MPSVLFTIGLLGSLPNPELLLQVPTFNSNENNSQRTSPSVATEATQQLASTPAGGIQSDFSMPEFPNIPAIPLKTCKKILAGEYIDMAELRPDSWRMEELLYLQSGDMAAPTPGRMTTGRKPVTDILTWMECFSSMAAVITSKHPEKAQHLFAYQRAIISASQRFDPAAWVAYVSRYRRKAAMTRSFE